MKSFRTELGVRRRSTEAVVLALLAVPNSAVADVVEIEWNATGHFEHTMSVAPGKPAEVCGTLPAGTAVRWDFESDAPMDFNVHYHVDKDVVFPFKRTAVRSAQDTLVAKIEQDYCWMWSNTSAAPTTLVIRLQR